MRFNNRSEGFNRSGGGDSQPHDPLNITPALKQILKRIDEVSQFLRERNLHQNIVVLMGEEHTTPIHKLLQGALFHELALRGRQFVFGTELPYNRLGEIISHEYAPLTADEKSIISLLDVDGSRSIASRFMSDKFTPYAPASDDTIYSMAKEFRIPTVFNDLARIRKEDSWEFDYTDPVTQRFMQDSEVTDLHVGTRGGMYIRNQMMARRLTDFMKERNINLAVQKTGSFHVLGSGKRLPFEQSLSSIFAYQENAVVIPVFIEDRAWNTSHLSDEAADFLERQGVVIQGLSGCRFFQGDSLEKDFIKDVAKASNQYLPVVRESDIAVYREDFELMIPSLVSDARAVRKQALMAPWYNPPVLN